MHSLKKAWHKIKERPSLAVFGSITDALYFFGIGLFTEYVSNIMEVQFSKVLQEFSRGLAQQQPELFNVLATNNITTALSINMAIYFAIIFVTYVLIQGTNWWIAKKYFDSPKYFKTILSFAKINIFWFALFVVFKLTDFILNLRYRLLESLQPGTIDIAGNTMLVLFYLGLGIATFGYAKQKTFAYFKIPFKKSSMILLTGALLFFVPYAIFYSLGNYNLLFSFMLQAIISFPTITFLRLYLMEELNVHARD